MYANYDLVIIGGGLVGLETADFLREKGVKNITIVEMLPASPVLALAAHGFMLHKRLRTAGIKLMLQTRVKKIEENAVVVEVQGEEKRIEPVAQVIVAIGVTPRTELKDMLAKKGIRHFVVGDAAAPGGDRRVFHHPQPALCQACEGEPLFRQ